MSDLISGPPKVVQQSHGLRTVRQVNLNEQRDDEKRHLAELEEHVREAKRRKQQGQKQKPLEEEPLQDDDSSEELEPEQDPSAEQTGLPAEQTGTPATEQTAETEDGHIDFTV